MLYKIHCIRGEDILVTTHCARDKCNITCCGTQLETPAGEARGKPSSYLPTCFHARVKCDAETR